MGRREVAGGGLVAGLGREQERESGSGGERGEEERRRGTKEK